MRVRPAMSRRLPLALTAVVAAALSLVLLAGSPSTTDQAAAADAETAALIGYFNQYRGSQDLGSLTTSATLNANAQEAANATMAQCGYVLPAGPGLKWGSYGYPTAASLWAVYQNDAQVLGWVGDPKYGSVGVGRAQSSSCNLGIIWWIILDKGGGGPPPPSQTQTNPPTQTPTTNATTPPVSSGTPAATATATPSPTAPSTATPSPSPSAAAGELRGDVNCDGAVNLADAVELVKAVGGAIAMAQCLTVNGLDCTGGIGTADLLALLRYLGNLLVVLPDGCPPIGSLITPTPAPTGEPTPTGTQSPVASATATPTAPPGTAMDHCWLALIAYDMTYPWTLDGDVSCAPADGAAYTCTFPFGNQVNCTSDAAADFSCYVFGEVDVPCVGSEDTDYICSRGETILCAAQGSGPTYECSVEGQAVTCTGPATFSWSPA